MTIQSINLGTYANDGTGDDLRTAFEKVNANFTELGTSDVRNGLNLGSGTAVFAQRNNDAQLEFKTLTSVDNSVAISSTTTTVNLAAITTVESDTTPSLGGDLNLNGHKIYGLGANIETKVYGIDITVLNGLLSMMIQAGSFDLDFGLINTPEGFDVYTVDMGTFIDPATNNNLNFGAFE
jgi:hypothetical protein